MDEPARYTIDMSTPPDDVETVHRLLEHVWAESPTVSLMDRMSFETALIELASNVMRHADSGTGVSCTLTIERSPDHLEARLSDSGLPGNVHLDRAEMPDDLSESGRGIPLIQALVDEVHYERTDSLNHWRICRRLES